MNVPFGGFRLFFFQHPLVSWRVNFVFFIYIYIYLKPSFGHDQCQLFQHAVVRIL